jgi:beta-glucosidase-like glycosyl hydrolase
MKIRHLLFKDRLRLFSNPKPLNEMTEDDYIAYAENLSRHLKSLETEADKEKRTLMMGRRDTNKLTTPTVSPPAHKIQRKNGTGKTPQITHLQANNIREVSQRTCLQHASAN